ncbi:MAG TPA: 30S ribosomal protein S12 methylthiotransferase RimO [Bacillota bacterium]|nr:30S ribosomal protein S12 methylthiotransferase RimO [Bacillota bacterium]
MPSVGLVSLGCAKNQIDSEIMLGLLTEAGFDVLGDPAAADLVIVNTCGFIDEAKRESIGAILDASEGRPEGRVVVTGCLAQRYPQELMRDMPEIAAVVGTGDFERIVEVCRDALAGRRTMAVGHAAARYDRLYPRRRLQRGPSAYIKIAEGCDHTCKFCAIPLFRGRFRSRALPLLVEEAKQLAAEGARELVLVSQDTISYGRDLEGRPMLAELLEVLAAVPEVRWVRPLYLYPYLIDDGLLDRWAAVPYFDIPLQHGSDAILAAMARPDRRAGILRLVAKIRDRFPTAAIRSSFIVGYPGETDAHFRELLALLDDCQFDHAGFFSFSPEDGTPAATLPGEVAEVVRDERYHEAMAHQARIAATRNAARVGQRLEVLVEGPVAGDDRYVEGRWHGQAPEVDGQVIMPAAGLRPGDFVLAEVEAAEDFDLLARGAAAPSHRRRKAQRAPR